MTAVPSRPAGSPRSPRSLRDVVSGDRVRVAGIDADVRVAKRLADLGLTPGASATVVHATPNALVVAVRGSRIALGLPLAGCISVEPEAVDDAAGRTSAKGTG